MRTSCRPHCRCVPCTRTSRTARRTTRSRRTISRSGRVACCATARSSQTRSPATTRRCTRRRTRSGQAGRACCAIRAKPPARPSSWVARRSPTSHATSRRSFRPPTRNAPFGQAAGAAAVRLTGVSAAWPRAASRRASLPRSRRREPSLKSAARGSLHARLPAPAATPVPSRSSRALYRNRRRPTPSSVRTVHSPRRQARSAPSAVPSALAVLRAPLWTHPTRVRTAARRSHGRGRRSSVATLPSSHPRARMGRARCASARLDRQAPSWSQPPLRWRPRPPRLRARWERLQASAHKGRSSSAGEQPSRNERPRATPRPPAAAAVRGYKHNRTALSSRPSRRCTHSSARTAPSCPLQTRNAPSVAPKGQ